MTDYPTINTVLNSMTKRERKAKIRRAKKIQPAPKWMWRKPGIDEAQSYLSYYAEQIVILLIGRINKGAYIRADINTIQRMEVLIHAGAGVAMGQALTYSSQADR